jgi:hypothetical protein
MERSEGMKRFLRRASVGVTAATVAVVGLTAAPALAAPVGSSVTFVSASFEATGGDLISGTVTCPSGNRMVGSGGSSLFGGDVEFTALAPTADFTGARFVAKVVEPPLDGREPTMRVTAYCAPAAQFTDVVTVRTNDHRFRPGQFSETIGRCPAGYYAFGGGGFYASGGFGFMGAAGSNSSNSPSADGTAWVYAGTMPPSANEQVTVIQCAPRTGRNVVVQFGNAATSPFSEISSFVDCPSGYTAIAGGFYASNPDGSVVHGAAVTESDQGGRAGRWFVLGFTQANTKLVALAQCVI